MVGIITPSVLFIYITLMSSQYLYIPRIPFCVYVLYRFALAAYLLAFLITSIVLGSETLGPRFFIYFPVWSYTATTCYGCFAFYNVVMDLKNRGNAAYEDNFRYQIQWFLFNIAAAPSLVVTTFDWGVSYYIASEKVPILFYVGIGLLPTVICLNEIFLTLIVVCFLHVFYSFLYMTIFLLFTVSYWAAWETDPFISPILDFQNHPAIAAATVVGVTLATLVAQAILKGLYALRVRCMDSRRTEAVPSTVVVSGVVREALTE